MQQHVDEAIAAGADFHLAKPVSVASLHGAVARALNSSSAGCARPVTTDTSVPSAMAEDMKRLVE
jgi:DNA-binding NarL/FixJ family response regulator